jgi:hypothetical protein
MAYRVNVERVGIEKKRMKKDKREDVEWMKCSKSRLETENRWNKTNGNKQHFYNKICHFAFSLFLQCSSWGLKFSAMGMGVHGAFKYLKGECVEFFLMQTLS